jgi:HSP20 family protein
MAEEHMAVKQTDSEQARAKEQERQSGQSQEGEQARQDQRGAAPQANQTGQQGSSDQERGMVRRVAPVLMSPFTLLQRFFMDDIPDLFGEFGISGGSRSRPRDMGADRLAWVPKIDVTQRGNDLIVRADLPGIKPDDVVVEISDDAITISGERQQEHEEDRGSVYRFERTYGSFFRTIPLPEGAIADQAKATFKDGVLEITVPAPPEQVSRGRRLEIAHGDAANTGAAKDEGKRQG